MYPSLSVKHTHFIYAHTHARTHTHTNTILHRIYPSLSISLTHTHTHTHTHQYYATTLHCVSIGIILSFTHFLFTAYNYQPPPPCPSLHPSLPFTLSPSLS